MFNLESFPNSYIHSVVCKAKNLGSCQKLYVISVNLDPDPQDNILAKTVFSNGYYRKLVGFMEV